METYDVVVVGSGSAGAMAALRASESGLSVIVIEKAHKYGGTSATSGGVFWIPNHQLTPNDDSAEQALQYLNSVTSGSIRRDRLETYVAQAPEMVRYLKSLGVNMTPMPWSDYYSEAPGARIDRCVVCPGFDGRQLGDKFPLMREQYSRFKLFNRYAADLGEFFVLATRGKGWKSTLLKIIWGYWTDFSTRKLGRRDRRFTSGGALIGQLYKRIFDRNIEVRLETTLEELVVTGGQVSGVRVNRFGDRYEIGARHGVIVCAGGFEWNQALRDRFLTIPGSIRYSSSPEGANTGDALLAGLKIGAATEHTESNWWQPTMDLPISSASNFEEIHQAAFDVGRPYSVSVNRQGHRFVNEACNYDDFGKGMIADQQKTGANCPCWLVFDANFRAKYNAGGFLTQEIMPDRSIPPDWWDHYIFRSETIEGLAAKIRVPAPALKTTVSNMNQYARTGVDPEFGRGGPVYDRMFGDPTVKPNGCLAPIDKAPFYAVPINLGDLGTKGGLKCDARARVLDGEEQPIAHLYAAGNASGSPFGDCYPGAGATIGPAMTFAYVAIDDIVARIGNERAGAGARAA